MEQFKQKFIDEATELLENLERDLLAFEKDTKSESILESIFRSMHTLKGSGSMFGYDRIVEIAHKTENIYSKIQNGEIAVSEKIINLSFSVSDLIRRLLHDDKNDTSIANKYNKTLEELNDFFSNDELESEKEQNKSEGQNLYYINFEPDVDVEERGVNLRAIFTQINNIGKTLVIPKNIDDDEKYSVCWEIFIATKEDIDELEEIMMFVDLECEITHVSDQNLLLNEDFIQVISDQSDANKIRTPEQISELANNIAPETIQEKPIGNKEQTDIVQQKNTTLRVNATKLDDLMNRVSALITLKSEIKLTAALKGYKEILELADKLEEITTQLKNDVFEIRLVELDTIRVNLERLIRDTAIQLKKEVQFTYEGLSTELDKTIVDSLLSPLLHIVRNSIDHGIEDTETRTQRGKTSHGNIKMKSFRSGAYVHVQIIDDGGGIDKEKIVQKAIQNNLIKQGDKLSDKDIFNLTLRSGFSTADNVTAVSGRGVGMDVVKSEVSKLRGDIEIESEHAVGTTITLKLPLSLSIVDTLLVQTGNIYFSIPLEEIERCELSKQEDINSSESNYLKLNNDLIPYISLREIFKPEKDFLATQKAIVIKKEDKNTAIIVDKIIGEFQAVVKPLGKAMEVNEFLSGGSLMADGNISYIIDTSKLIEFYHK